jgi:DNA-binding transcriptional LysR family regulator
MQVRIETQELRMLAAVIENSGFKHAAQSLHVTQSAVSQAIANLERKLDQKLLERSPLAPTEAGKRILTYARSQAREEELLLGDLQDIQRGQSARLSLAVNSAISRYHIAPLISAYCRQSPYARLQVEELPSRQVIQAVVAGIVEIGMGPFQTHMPAVECQPLYDELRTLVISRHHPLLPAVLEDPLATLLRLPLLASYLDDPEDRPATQRIRDNFRDVWELRPIGLRLELLAAGHGVGFVSDLVLAREPLCADMVEIPGLPFSRIPRSVGLFYRRGARVSTGARAFLELCRDRWLR